MVKMSYKGSIKYLKNEVVVVLDETNNVVNFFVKNFEHNDVECHQVLKDYIDTFSGDRLMQKACECWSYLWSDLALLEEHSFLQTYPLEFWDDIVIPITKYDGTPKNIITRVKKTVSK